MARKKWVLPLILFALFLSIGCFFYNRQTDVAYADNDKKSAGNNTQKVRVGWYNADGFQEGKSDDEKKSGYSYEYLQSVANYAGWEYEYVYGDWDDLYGKFLNGEVDILAGLPFTEENALIMNFPAYDMGEFSFYGYTLGDNTEISDAQSFDHKVIGIESSYKELINIDGWIFDNSLNCRIITYDSSEKRDAALENGEVDAIVAMKGSISEEYNFKRTVKMGSIIGYLAVTKNRIDLVEQLNSALVFMLERNPYYLTSLQIKYSETANVDSVLTTQENKWINNHDVIRIGYVDDYLPFCGEDKDGNVTGAIIDIFDEWLESLKLQDAIKIEYVKYDLYTDMTDALQKDEIDAAFPIADCSWLTECNNIAQTSNLLESSVCIIYKGEYNNETTDKIAISNHSAFQRTYVTENYKDSTILEVDSVEACLDAVLSGKAECTIFTGGRSERYLSKSKYKDLKGLTLGEGVNFCVGVKKGNNVVYSLLERSMCRVDKSVMTNVMYKYTSNQSTYTLEDIMRNNMVLVLLVAIIIISLVIAIAIILAVMLRKSKKQSENEMRMLRITSKQKEELEERDSIIENAGYGVWHIILENDKLPRMKATPKLLEILGISGTAMSEEEIYEYWYSRINDEALPSVLQSVAQMMEGEFSENTYLWNHPAKGEIYTRCGGFAQTISPTKQVLTGYHSDVSTIVKNEEENKRMLEMTKQLAEQANDAKTSFLFNMSHDIRTPMNAILGFAELMDRHQDEPEKRKSYIAKIKASGEILMSILNNVLEMARIEKGTVSIEEKAWSAKEFCEDLKYVFAEQMAQKNISFEIRYDVTHQYVMCDSVKLREVFMNILSNAYKYTQEGGKVVMKLEEISSSREGYVFYKTTISDNGIGMSKEFQPHLFEEFAREKNSEKNNIEGTGLGMQIVKRLVELMEGKIYVESEKGIGSTFTVIIPHKIAHKKDIKEHYAVEVETDDFDGKRILLAEDNDLNAEIAMDMLADVGFEVERAEDGKVCTQMIEDKPAGYYSLILMDIQMPVMNGYEATEAIRYNRDIRKAKIPIIAMTANAFEEDKKEALAAGMNAHLGKPIIVADLIRTLAETLNN